MWLSVHRYPPRRSVRRRARSIDKVRTPSYLLGTSPAHPDCASVQP